MKRAARALVSLYPLAWRRRYGEEMRALIDEGEIRPVDLLDLLAGAVASHVRPRSRAVGALAPAERLRTTVGAVALCWGALALAGAGFAKETEDPGFGAAGRAHQLLGALHGTITGLALAAALVVALTGAPLLAWVVRVAWRERRRDLAGLLALPPLAVAAFAGVTAFLGWWLDSRPGGNPGAGRGLFLAWAMLATGTAAICALAPRLVLARVAAPEVLLRLAVRGAVALSACMAAITLAAGLYTVVLAIAAPAQARVSGGPLWATTALALAFGEVVMVLATTLAAISTVRGAAALRVSAAAASEPDARG